MTEVNNIMTQHVTYDLIVLIICLLFPIFIIFSQLLSHWYLVEKIIKRIYGIIRHPKRSILLIRALYLKKTLLSNVSNEYNKHIKLNETYYLGNIEEYRPHNFKNLKDILKLPIIESYRYLNQVSRSFSLVILSIVDLKLRESICIFYLILRCLDTIEDDLSPNIVFDDKIRLMEDFVYNSLGKDDLSIENYGTGIEKELLSKYGRVIGHVYTTNLSDYHRDVIRDVSIGMCMGMIYYLKRRDEVVKVQNKIDETILTISDYDNYCFYVAGLVGVGLTRLYCGDFKIEDINNFYDKYYTKSTVNYNTSHNDVSVDTPKSEWSDLTNSDYIKSVLESDEEYDDYVEIKRNSKFRTASIDAPLKRHSGLSKCLLNIAGMSSRETIDSIRINDHKFKDNVSNICEDVQSIFNQYSDRREGKIEKLQHLSNLSTRESIYRDKSFLNLEIDAIEMGLFLQKTNIIRDLLEDLQEFPENPRTFYPKEIWAEYVPCITDLIPNHITNIYRANRDNHYSIYNSLNCLNHMISNALCHIPAVLRYLRIIWELSEDPSIFRFCAIPQIMALATLSKCWNNSLVFTQNVKIERSLTCEIIFNISVDFKKVLSYFDQTFYQSKSSLWRVDSSFFMDDLKQQKSIPDLYENVLKIQESIDMFKAAC